jgi:hypothetical protein
MLSRYSVATQTQTLGGVQKTLPDSSSCWVAIASPSPAVRPAEFNRMLKATTPELAVGYNKGGSELLNEPHRVLVDGEPSLIFSIRLLTGAWQSHVATSHKGRVYAMLCEASNSRTFEHCTADFHTILATWQWM